jgi:hypothetical protein
MLTELRTFPAYQNPTCQYEERWTPS